jgi:hypothetical protein
MGVLLVAHLTAVALLHAVDALFTVFVATLAIQWADAVAFDHSH